jgi:hypothetical protein
MKTHLTDDRLAELCFTETPSAHEQQHLGSCPDCERRRAAIVHLLDETALASAEDVEVAFPAERLALQQAQILERAESAVGPARVIAFPAAPAPVPGVISRTSTSTRWVAAAAVAGLLVGVVAGRVGRDYRPAVGSAGAATVAAMQAGGKDIRAVSSSMSDEQFLQELESAIENRGGGALHALDVLTPRAWER